MSGTILKPGIECKSFELYYPGPGTPLSIIYFFSKGPPRKDLAKPSILPSYLLSIS